MAEETRAQERKLTEEAIRQLKNNAHLQANSIAQHANSIAQLKDLIATLSLKCDQVISKTAANSNTTSMEIPRTFRRAARFRRAVRRSILRDSPVKIPRGGCISVRDSSNLTTLWRSVGLRWP